MVCGKMGNKSRDSREVANTAIVIHDPVSIAIVPLQTVIYTNDNERLLLTVLPTDKLTSVCHCHI